MHHADGAPPAFDPRVAALTFLIGVVSLGYEILQVRMLSFFLGNSMDFLAIPIALLGLAIGSMFRHFGYKGTHADLVTWGSRAVLPAMAFGFLVFFGVANTWFSEIHVAIATPPREAVKVVIYSLIFLPPYMVFGALFSTLFDAYSRDIGKLYFFDLTGAAVGCAITPLLLTWLGLPPAIFLLLCGGLALFALQGGPRWMTGVAAALVLALGLGQEAVLRERPDPNVLGRSILGPWKGDRIVEVDARWNEIARTALLRAEWDDGRRPVYAIVQDNGLSNVTVDAYNPDAIQPDAFKRVLHYGIPWTIGMSPERILVMFAGHGRDMIAFNEITQQQADIVGVEINRTVVAWNRHPALKRNRLGEFHDRPNIHLHAEEGRDFLNRDTRTYDLIYVANNGAVHASRTGHTRKFLDTYQAMEAYLDRLDPQGVMVFVVQPLYDKLPSLVQLARERYDRDLKDVVYAFGDPVISEMDTLVFKPSGFSEAELKALDLAVRNHKAHRLHRPGSQPQERLRGYFEAPIMVTDDRPFTRPIGWSNLSLRPDPARYFEPAYVSGWVKAFTVVLFAGVAFGVALVAGLVGRPEQRVPGMWVAYLLASGVGYMCVQIPLIAKTELFIGNPLYAVSINLAVFLVANAVGAWLQDARGLFSGPLALAAGVLAGVVWGLGAVNVAAMSLLSLPLAAKVLGVVVCVAPLGVALGAFYPYCVARIVASGQARAIPMTYGLTTLSSVLGSALAMTLIVDLGFTRVILIGTVAYFLAAGLASLVRR